jgi:O-antigen/teichoic acid export membrane protein
MSTRRSLLFSFLDRYAGLSVNVVSTMVLARLLTPTEIGVFSVTMMLLAIAGTLRDMGAGQYLVQRRELTTAHVQAVWSVQLGLSLLIAGVVLLAGRPAASFYGEPRISDIMVVVAASYAIKPFGSLTYAWLVREMRFERLAVIRFSAASVGAGTSIGLAWSGFGPISLAYGALASSVATMMISSAFRPRWFPWRPALTGTRDVLRFGSHLTGGVLLNEVAASAPEVFLGKLQGLTEAGFYSRANGLMQMFHRLVVDAVMTVCMPWFATQMRQQSNLTEGFLRATSYVTAVGWSFCAAVACLAYPIIRVLYGDQWSASVDLARILALAMACSLPAVLCQAALVAMGRLGDVSRVAAKNALVTATCASVGATFGTISLCVALCVSAAAASAISLHALCRSSGLQPARLVRELMPSMGVAIASAAGPAVVLMLWGSRPDQLLAPLIIGALSSMLGLVIGVFAVSHPLRAEIEPLYRKVLQKLNS